ncbi:YciK family oxidoreductase [Tatumella citrea]|uniref:YciK family oxidoreductase n=1 Tax=Tatumella citrea TaxID=53336 RepID=A0A1Y0LJX0_TATCI|nr:YciK family oxidoreductase [Tatumella citrea]ARU94117.1 YciK family oxidoreductase [Tatumella citrea]ARU98157.1 YciK family oxidoreductase [Tatumella citrea]
MNSIPDSSLLKNRTILVTGASDGIGREAAITYARQGARVILTGRNPQKLEQVRQTINALQQQPASVLVLDLATATAEDCQQFAREVAAITPTLEGLLHNAGILGTLQPMSEISAEEWQQVMKINLDACFFLTRALLPLLLNATSASLVFTSSSVGRQGRAGWGTYSVSKFATEGMMQVLAAEYRDSGLRVNCINPGGTRTTMRASAFPEENASLLRTPADIMPVYLHVMSDASIGETGISFDAQPGRKAGPAS